MDHSTAGRTPERILVANTLVGEWTVFNPNVAQPRALRASILRALWLGQKAPEDWEGFDWPDGPSALRIRGAQISGELDLTDVSRSGGGILPPLLLNDCDFPSPIDLSHARLARLSLSHSRITHLCAHGMRVEGPFDFVELRAFPCDQDDASAWIDARGSSIGGEIDGRGAHLRAPPPRSAPEVKKDDERYALRLSNCDIRGRVNLTDRFRAVGGVSLSDSDIRGEVWLHEANLSAGEGEALRAQSARFGSAVILDHLTTEGEIRLLGATIAGPLQMSNAVVTNIKDDGSGVALAAEQTRIGGAVRLDNLKAEGLVSFAIATVGNNFVCTNASLRSESGALNLFNTTIRSDLLLDRSTIIGATNLWGSQIGGDCSLVEAQIIHPFGALALSAPDLRITGRFSLESASVLGSLALQNLETSRDLDCTNLAFLKRFQYCRRRYEPIFTAPPHLALAHAKIGAKLKLHCLSSETGDLAIDLSGARTAALDDKWPDGWGGDTAIARKTRLDLDGFVYDRIVDIEEVSSVSFCRFLNNARRFFTAGTRWQDEDWISMRLRWLRLQNGDFVPQPYRQLSKILRVQGHERAARIVAISEQWKTPTTLTSFLPRFLFGIGFGFGLAPIQAFLTLLMFIVLGWAIVEAAQCRGALVASIPRVALMGAKILPIDAPSAEAQAVKTEIPCGARIIPLFYSIDLMLPVIPLHQETKCDISNRREFLGWQVLKSAFSILGKVVTALALLTFSGVVRPRSPE